MNSKLLKLYFQLIYISVTSVTTLTALYARPGCNDTCGNMRIPYPFGIGQGCYHNEWYAVDCRSSTAYLSAINNLEIFALNLENQTVTVNVFMTSDCQNTVRNSSQILSVDLRGSPFLFSQEHNRFTVEGCGNAVIMEQGNLLTGCSTICQNGMVNLTNNCYGINCCQTTLPYYLETYSVNNSGLQRQSADGACGSAFLVDERWSAARRSSGQSAVVDSYVPISLRWRLTEGDISGTNCSSRGEDLLLGNGTSVGSYKCSCSPVQEGTPYLSNGCQLVAACNNCTGECKSNRGNITCVPYPFTVTRSKSSTLAVILGVSISIGLLILSASTFALYQLIQKTKDNRRKQRFFRRNGGLLLKQQESANDDGLVDKTTLFTAKELEKATDHFNENRILGRGGQGTVYKGMLTDGRIVAVKKSKIVDESQLEQFINEVVILSQVNHRNVVKLLGCCLETEVPLLVSEFVSNGTLYEHIHDDSDDFPLTLNTRLRISTEIAGALAYLHSATSIPIYHRDIKSTNILLDDKYRAKVSDFGTSRFVSIDQTHLTTLVKGTFGYLDPEYFQSSQFTEKSDVYSFGVVLVELLTGEKPISLTRFGEHRSLATYFMMTMEESQVMSIIDSRIISEGSRGELMAVANLAMQCLNLNGKNRPTMKEVASELERIRTSHVPSTIQTDYRKPKYNAGEEEMIMFSFDDSTLHKLYIQLIFISITSVTTITALYARPGCNYTCGNTLIPYPFGIGPGCYYNEWYAVDCRLSAPYLSAIENLKIFAFNLENQTVTVNIFMTSDCQNTVRNSSQNLSVDLRGSPFLFSQKHNRFTVEGCGNAVILEQENLLTGCSTICQNGPVNLTNNCYGINCCQTTIPHYLERYSVNTSGLQRQSADGACGSAFLVDEQLSAARRSSGQSAVVDSYVPISLRWRLTKGDITLAQSPVSEEDLMVHILTQLGDEYTPIASALKVRETPISYPELLDKLVDFERSLKPADEPVTPIIATANATQKQQSRPTYRSSYGSQPRNQRSQQSSSFQRASRSNSSTRFQRGSSFNRNDQFCNFCEINGHDTPDCRKLQRFLKENRIVFNNSNPVANTATTKSGSHMWMMDSGASHHLSSSPSALTSVSDYGGPDEVVLGNGMGLSISHIGSTQFSTKTKPLTLPNILCAPNLRTNLISVAKLCRTNQVSVEFFPFHFFVKDLKTGAPIMRGENIHDVYYLNQLSQFPQVNTTTSVSPLQWHHRLGHPCFRTFKFLCKDLGLNFKSLSYSTLHCPSCSINKCHKLPFGSNSFVATKPLQLLYSDVWGPVQQSIDGFKYYVVFFQSQIISLFTDNGGEFIGLLPFLQSMGISHYTTPPHTPEQNGIAERRHRHIVETGLALLHYAGLPLSFWSHAFQTAVYLINRLPTPNLNSKTPYHMLYRASPNYTKLKTFGCLCYPWLKPYATSKLEPRSQPCIFLGYSTSKSAYKCFDSRTNRLYHSRHVVFVEDNFPFKQKKFTLPTPRDFPYNNSCPPSMHIPLPNSPQINAPPLHASTTHDSQQNEPTSPVQISTPHSPPSTSTPSSISHATDELSTTQPSATPLSTTSQTPSSPSNSVLQSTHPPLPPRPRKPNPKYYNSHYVNTTTVHPIPPSLEPKTYLQASKDPLWRKAMDDEYNALLRNQTWELVAPSAREPIGCKWVFRIKRRSDGSIDKYKARLVAKGFLQEYGKDYFDTFSPVTKPVTIRTVLAIALSKDWPLRQLDVNNAFLHGHLHEEVYMIQPRGYVHPQFPNHVCKLRRSLYGLKQAPRAWYMELTSFLTDFGFIKSHADASLFIYNHGDTKCYFLVYVDDIILTSNNNKFLDHFVPSIASRFSVKDLGYPSQFLGVELIPTTNGLFLSQSRHIHDLLSLHRMDGAKSVNTPLCSSQVLTLEDGTPKVDSTPYRKLVGSLQYLAFTRPDISFAVNKLSQFMHQPTQTHWQALKRLLRYLKGTIYHGLFLKKSSPFELTAFSDSDWGGVSTAGRSTTAYLIYLGGNIISWKSARQKSVSRSSTEAEYKALANAAAELAWVENLLKDLGVSVNVPPRLFCDNTGATYLCANPVYHSRMKHVALDYHFVREKVAAGTLRVHHINSKDQLADALTKPLSRAPFLQLRSKIGVSDGTSILRGQCKYCNGKCNLNDGNNSCSPVSPRLTVYIDKVSMVVAILALNLIIGIILIPYIYSLYKLIQKTKDKRRKQRFFKRNGGLLYKQKESADDSLVDKTTLFTAKELEKATDYFNENRILGRGGQGTVYKGMLTDGRIVAVKKSKIVDESQLEQFINEVVILSQVNHRNVVKLLGCCLETEVPLLVSEFISNGTLYQQIHDDSNEFPLTLNTRLRISTEIAGALAYLHSATSIPIYHRDIKSTNILLDSKQRAKVSDFGTSRFVSIDQTHLTTLVKGTFGYLDPEYFQSGKFTEKSDVYSFGVVLVELLTGEKPISVTRFDEHRSLVTHFKTAMEEDHLMSITDLRIINEGSRGELMAVANLAMQCLNLNGKNRPTMKEVASELERVRTSHVPSAVQTDYRKPNYNAGEEEMILFSFD
uniref:uncharacterized protein LOC122587696 n=1 Tax=Erigeron canadensis TaxID=72917 RepID=UPI001CB9CF6D|nr:uncharacterized protein LOC122587696 [Erigeron canadensis]